MTTLFCVSFSRTAVSGVEIQNNQRIGIYGDSKRGKQKKKRKKRSDRDVYHLENYDHGEKIQNKCE